MAKVVWFLTTNDGKVAEARAHLSHLGYQVEQLLIQDFEIIEPQADDLYSVAKQKLAQAREHLPSNFGDDDILLVEDAGLFIDALDGFPGVYSSYVHSTIGLDGILRLLAHLEPVDPVKSAKLRSAHFMAVCAALVGEEILIGSGKCLGHISQESVEGNGFGYDPIFIPYDLDSSKETLSAGEYGKYSTHGVPFGGVSGEIKQIFSHRTKALIDLFNQFPSA